MKEDSRDKEAEETRFQLAAIVESSDDAIIAKTLDGEIISWNGGAEKIYGYAAPEVVGQSISILVPAGLPDDMPVLLQKISRGEHIHHYETVRRRKDGRLIHVSLTISPIKDASGRIIGASSISRDITARKKIEEAVKESEQKLHFLTSQILRVQDNERSRLSREIHDGLGQPLMALKLQIRIVEKELPKEQKGLKQKCRFALQYIDEIIEDLRRLSRDLCPPVLEDFGLAAGLSILCREFSRLHDLEIRVDMDDIEDLFSQAAKINIYRIYQEGFTNIAQYAQATQVKVDAKKRGNEVFFVLEDDGKGFNVAQVLTNGGGLGLAAMQERTRILHGSFTISSQEGKGTVISFAIPSDMEGLSRNR
jgi:PAS domain S-box-containing protein